jgi:hypothetical protein
MEHPRKPPFWITCDTSPATPLKRIPAIKDFADLTPSRPEPPGGNRIAAAAP